MLGLWKLIYNVYNVYYTLTPRIYVCLSYVVRMSGRKVPLDFWLCTINSTTFYYVISACNILAGCDGQFMVKCAQNGLLLSNSTTNSTRKWNRKNILNLTCSGKLAPKNKNGKKKFFWRQIYCRKQLHFLVWFNSSVKNAYSQ